MPTLLVIHDDLIAPLTPWPVDVVEPALYCPKGRGDHRDGYLPEDGYFIGRTYERFGAVGVLNAYYRAPLTEFRFRLYANSNCLPAVAIPRMVFGGCLAAPDPILLKP